jgi:signal transduction histidine kinase
VIRFDLDLARAQRQHAGTHRIVAVAAGGVALGLFLLPILLGRSLGRALFLPLDRMSEAIRSYTHDRGRRAPEGGSDEIRRIACTFNLAASEIQRQRESQVRFLAGVARDLGGPLAALRGALALVKPDPAREASLTRPLFIAKRSVDRVTATVEDLLDISRVELGELPLACTRCDLRDVVRDAAARSEPGASILQVVLPGGCVPAWCDARRIGQVLNNLVSNAVRYSPEGSLICVKARKEGEAAVLEVIDTGIGVPPDEQDEIFEPFRRSTLTRDSIPGVGLGLFVSRKLVEAHGGQLTVDSTPGRGSTFRVSLPNAPLPPSTGLPGTCGSPAAS